MIATSNELFTNADGTTAVEFGFNAAFIAVIALSAYTAVEPNLPLLFKLTMAMPWH